MVDVTQMSDVEVRAARMKDVQTLVFWLGMETLVLLLNLIALLFWHGLVDGLTRAIVMLCLAVATIVVSVKGVIEILPGSRRALSLRFRELDLRQAGQWGPF